MKIQQIGDRGVLFTFYELNNCPTSVFAIVGKSHFFICDTFLGPAAMGDVKSHLLSHYRANPFIIFNSHFHWDHIWGNCAFKSSLIISHETCRDTIVKEGVSELEKYGGLKMGEVKLILPSITFRESISFPDEKIKFFHSPGHTRDSSSCLDEMDNTLFVGDNVEAPIPYLACEDLHTYIKTLKGYLEMESEKIIAGHGDVIEKTLIKHNIEYIEDFILGKTKEYENGECGSIHSMNIEIQGKINKKK